MSRSERILVQDILESIARIGSYVADMSREAFLKDPLVQDAVVRRIEVIGEAVKGLSDDLRDKHPNIPWREIAGAGDILIHEYFRVDLSMTWDMVQEDLPGLRARLEDILSELA